jgi:hypothetical protein
MTTAEEVKLLFAEFPRDAISWRAQSVTKDGDKAMALAYIDARDVMDRLDSVCGASDWQDRYEFHGSRTVCYLSIRVDGEWITKADGAGDSDVEAEKGAISDALKRAAVKWGIGRYLYALDAPWVPCQSSDWNGKKQWKKWTADPWDFVKGAKPSVPKGDARPIFSQLERDMRANKTKTDLRVWFTSAATKDLRSKIPSDWDENLRQSMADYAATLPEGTKNLTMAG